ncbi:MAG: DUF2851 family protein [Bacteroidota bacterium]
MHEDLLRHIWAKQLFDSSRLVTTDGQAVCVFDPGILSRKSGPDFRNARIEIGNTTFAGDIEFHRTFSDWNLHNHQHNPHYNSVILHVVLSGNARETPSLSGRNIPSVILESFLTSSIGTIENHLLREEYASKKNKIRCASVNDSIAPALLNDWIRTLYRERLQKKVHRLHDRLCDIIISQNRIIGEPHSSYHDIIDEIPLPDSTVDRQLFKQRLAWEQLLYEEVLDGLGYSNNRKPMKRLAETISLIVLKNIDATIELSSLHIEAILFKASGLLPELNEMTDQDSKVHIHTLHAAWNELPKKLSFVPIDQTVWNFSPTRPSNFPTIRIAAASGFVQKLLHQSLFRSIITLTEGKFSSPQSKIEQLVSLFETGNNPFWNYHYSFGEPVHKKHAVLGDSRRHDIIVNTIIPFVCLYSKIFGNESLFDHCLALALEIPLLEDNSILRIMNSQLVKKKIVLKFAHQQQGLIQLHKQYCVAERCSECEIGKAVFKS